MGDRYNPLYELGAGAFGKAWVVKDNKTQRKCVSKVIQIKGLSSAALDRCVTEVAVLSACSHVNIVRYIEAFVSDGALHIMMEFASGGDLQQRIEKQNGVFFSSDMILDWFLQVIMALEYIHSKNILHRDLKPQNIFLTEIGVVKLGDFGIARVLNSCDDLASTSIGTPFYISPEICRRKPYNSRSDMWAAGCLLYQICTLNVPFHASNFDDLTKKIIKAEYDPIPSHFDAAIQFVIPRLLVSTPTSRLSASQILSMKSVHGMVMYLKHKYRVNSQASRTRSSSLVTNGSKTEIGHKSRSSSVSRLQRHSVWSSDETLQSNFQVKDQRQDTVHASGMVRIESRNDQMTKITQNVGCVEGSIDKNDNQIGQKYGNEKNIYHSPKVKCVNNEDITQSRGEKTTEQKWLVGYGVVEENGFLNSDLADGNGKRTYPDGSEQHTSRENKVNSRTIAIKDSVARRLSEASPSLSVTVRKQRFSLSLSEQGTMDKVKNSEENQELVFNDVFQSPDIQSKRRLNSQTYLLKEKGQNDVNNNDVKSDNKTVERKCSNTELDSVNVAMIQALSVSKVSKDLADTIILKEIRLRVGNERCEELISQVNKLVEDGHRYQHFVSQFNGSERTLIPLVCMFLAI